MQRDNENQSADESLDEMIRAALALGTDEKRLRRLEHFWHRQSRRQSRQRKVFMALPLAAAAVATVALGAILWNRHEGTQLAQASRNVATGNDSAPTDPANVDRTPVDDPHLVSRPPTVYEQFMFMARTSAQTPATATTVIDEAINQLRLNSEADAKQAIETAGLERGIAEALLLRRLPRSPNEDQLAILRLLAVCGSPRAAPTLLRLSGNEALRDEALQTVEQIVGIENLAELVGMTPDRRVRAALIRRLLRADSEPALLGYLSLLRDDKTRDEALSLAAEIPDKAIATLVALLDHQEESVRLSAAMALGRVDDREVTKLLIARVTNRPSDSTEAWMALMACHDKLADEFLAYATQRPQLLGHFNTARLRWTQMIPQYFN